MPTPAGYSSGTPCWVDLTSTDPEAARAFYAELFGWDWGEPDVPGGGRYWTARLGGAAVAGMPDGVSSRPSTWLTYVSVTDCDTATQHAQRLGANVIAEPLDVGPAGRRSFISDPAGAWLGLWQAGEHIGADRTSEPGAMIWNEVYTPDPSAVGAFYEGLFGWEVGSMTMPDGSDYTTFSLDGNMIGGTAPPPSEVQPHWHVWFGSADVVGDAGRVGALGGAVTVEPTAFEGGHYASLVDPAGAAFSIITAPQG